jgi:hypothetical protein
LSGGWRREDAVEEPERLLSWLREVAAWGVSFNANMSTLQWWVGGWVRDGKKKRAGRGVGYDEGECRESVK